MPPRRTTSARRNAATQTSPAQGDDNKEKSVRDVEARLEAERRLTEELRQEVALLKDQERDARSDADALRTGLDTIRDGAARLARRCDDLADAAKKQRDDNAKAHRVRELEVEVARLARELKMARAADGAAKTDEADVSTGAGALLPEHEGSTHATRIPYGHPSPQVPHAHPSDLRAFF